eukprot:m.60167 g.60167  ORF g.60167 m.60167 type:complete len:239 (+) comp7010_c0_seq1:12-728(+)
MAGLLARTARSTLASMFATPSLGPGMLRPLARHTHSGHHRQHRSHPQRTCWRCGKPTDAHGFFCVVCGTIQPPSTSSTHFELFNTEASFAAELPTLERAFRSMQFRLHPDRFSLKSEKEKELSSLQSAHVNKAYEVLRNPLSRGHYLLELQGIHGDVQLDAPFLMEVMELNEELEDARKDGKRLAALHATIKGKYDECITDTTAAFARKDYQAARFALARTRYFDNLSKAVRECLASV